MSEADRLVGELINGVEKFAEEFVGNEAYVPRWPHDPKILHDPLWGTVRLSPWEVAILDLPLVQRLRQIRQTSLVNYVFPGCNHSRFEHTIGVMHQSQRLAEAVNSQYRDGSEWPFGRKNILDLRLAALFHDTGHCCFSHVSENVLQFCPDMIAATADDGPYPGCHPHEVLSALILKSSPVRKYLRSIEEHYTEEFGEKKLDVDAAAAWIVGLEDKTNPKYISDVINGPFDADKLDYIFRDSHYSGLPMALDLDRLWASCDTTSRVQNGNTEKVLTLHRGSTTPIEQILFNKVNLFATVYQHPKVRAAESMFQGVVEYCKENSLTFRDRNLSSSTDFLWLTDDCFFGEALSRPKEHQLHKLVHDILYRRHFLRALTISRETVEVENGPDSYQRILRLTQRNMYDARRDLARKIWERAQEPCLRSQIWVDLPPMPRKGEADRIWIRMPGGSLQLLGEQFSLDFWVDQYFSHKWRGHVFCPPECQKQVYAAAKTVLENEFGLKFNDLSWQLSHVSA